MKKLMVLLLITSLALVTNCSHNIMMWSSYPIGVEKVFEQNVGTIFIDEFEMADEAVKQQWTEQHNDGTLFYVQDPEIQQLDEYIRGAFLQDFDNSGLFTITNERDKADYILSGKIQQHHAIKKTNQNSTALAALLYLPTLGISLLFIRDDTDAITELELELLDQNESVVFKELYTRQIHISTPKYKKLNYSAGYHRIKTLKMVVRQAINDIDKILKTS